ncbi:unnamed protein product [Effrenium voratum]|nr:unnamed protein product [Effrenium voratum]
MQELMLAAAQYTELATSLRQKGETGRAVRTMERAVGMCAKSEYDHPALAVETARARINLAAALSEASRHRAALGAVKRAQGALGRVLAWAEVKSISEEARALRCAALVAESIQMELCPGPGRPRRAPPGWAFWGGVGVGRGLETKRKPIECHFFCPMEHSWASKADPNG